MYYGDAENNIKPNVTFIEEINKFPKLWEVASRIEGLIIGVLGSIIPVLVTIYGYSFLYEKTGGKIFSQFIRLVKPFPFVLNISVVLLIIGAVVGMIGSNRAVRKYLKI